MIQEKNLNLKSKKNSSSDTNDAAFVPPIPPRLDSYHTEYSMPPSVWVAKTMPLVPNDVFLSYVAFSRFVALNKHINLDDVPRPPDKCLTDVIAYKMSLTVKEYLKVRDLFAYGSDAITMEHFQNNLLISRLIRTLLTFNKSQRTAIFNILLCCRRWKLSKCSVPSCSHERRTLFRCHDRYCKCFSCGSYRYARAFDMVNHLQFYDAEGRCLMKTVQFLEDGQKKVRKQTFIERFPRVYHFALGSNMLSKKELDKVCLKLQKRMRNPSEKSGLIAYKFNYIRCFDIGFKGFDKTGKLYNHYHIAVFGENIKPALFYNRVYSELQKINKNVIFQNIGWRRSVGVVHYFSNRIAGRYGHKSDAPLGSANPWRYMPEFLTLNDYMSLYFKKRFFFVSFPKGKFIVTPIIKPKLACPIHKVPLIPDGFADILGYAQYDEGGT